MKLAPAVTDSPAAALALAPASALAADRDPTDLVAVSLLAPGRFSIVVLGVRRLVVCALPTDLCLAQGAIEYGRGSPGIFLYLLFFILCVALC